MPHATSFYILQMHIKKGIIWTSTSLVDMSTKEMSDISQQPPTDPPSADEGDEGGSLLPQERLKRFFLAVPLLSLLVGGALLVAEVIIIVLMLVTPAMLGVSEELALTATQRGVLGGVSILMLIEAAAFGIIDIGRVLLRNVDIYNKYYKCKCILFGLQKNGSVMIYNLY